jgi:hypothetical protein
LLLCGVGAGRKKFRWQIADFFLLRNKAAEARAKSDRVGFDSYFVIADSKALLLKFCKPPDHFAWLAGNI